MPFVLWYNPENESSCLNLWFVVSFGRRSTLTGKGCLSQIPHFVHVEMIPLHVLKSAACTLESTWSSLEADNSWALIQSRIFTSPAPINNILDCCLPLSNQPQRGPCPTENSLTFAIIHFCFHRAGCLYPRRSNMSSFCWANWPNSPVPLS